MSAELYTRWQAAHDSGEPCVLVTVAETRGSVPRAAGAKMLVFAAGVPSLGTVGGGKFESLVEAEARALLSGELPLLKTFPLHEAAQDSFGAICGGESTVLFEPNPPRDRLVLVGAGHCAEAIASLALRCGWHVTVLDDREELFNDFPKVHRQIRDQSAPDFILTHPWRAREALVLVSRNWMIDQAALAAALASPPMAYLGMIGSQRKVRKVFSQLLAEGAATPEQLARVYAPIGLDIGADSPWEIAISLLAEILRVFRQRPGGHLKLDFIPNSASDTCVTLDNAR